MCESDGRMSAMASRSGGEGRPVMRSIPNDGKWLRMAWIAATASAAVWRLLRMERVASSKDWTPSEILFTPWEWSDSRVSGVASSGWSSTVHSDSGVRTPLARRASRIGASGQSAGDPPPK